MKLNGVIESVQCMSTLFYNFGQQLKTLISLINKLKNETKYIEK